MFGLLVGRLLFDCMVRSVVGLLNGCCLLVYWFSGWFVCHWLTCVLGLALHGDFLVSLMFVCQLSGPCVFFHCQMDGLTCVGCFFWLFVNCVFFIF